jgi:hypothetical protein
LEAPNFPVVDSITIESRGLPINRDARVHSLHGGADLDAYELPQLIVKKSILKASFKLRELRAMRPSAVLFVPLAVFPSICLTGATIGCACLSFRSNLSAYYLALTSRLAFDRAEALSDHLLDVPVPQPNVSLLENNINLDEIDSLIEQAFRLKEPEQALISDLLKFGYREGAKRSGERPSRAATIRSDDEDRDDLLRYADFFLRTLRATFGKERAVRATVFEESEGQSRLPVRIVAIHLDWPQRRRLRTKVIMEPDQLRAELARFYADQLTVRTREGTPIASGLGFRRVARIFISHEADDGTKIPSVLFVKPDQRRYWTRSQGLRDADELATTLVANRQKRIVAK